MKAVAGFGLVGGGRERVQRSSIKQRHGEALNESMNQ